MINIETLVIIIVGLIAMAFTIHCAKHWRGDKYLCDDCQFNDPNLCHKEARPKAITCLAYMKK